MPENPRVSIRSWPGSATIFEMVRRTVGKTLNAMLDAAGPAVWLPAVTSAAELGRTPGHGSYDRTLQTSAGEVSLKVPKLRRLTFETAIIERYRRRESSVEERTDRDVSGGHLGATRGGHH